MYNFRIGLVIFDWNENVDRFVLLVKNVVCVCNLRCRFVVWVLKLKIFDFVDVLWVKFSRYVEYFCL